MSTFLKVLKPAALIILLSGMVWYFYDVFIFICISIVLSIIGRPLVAVYSNLRIKKIIFGNTIASILTLLTIILIVVSFFLFLVPLIISQANLISSINVNSISVYYSGFLKDLYEFLLLYDLVEPGQNISTLFDVQMSQALEMVSFSNIFNHFISTTSSVLMAVFMILFLTFFFLKEPQLIKNAILFLTPDEYETQVNKILTDSRYMLTRYFIGILVELTSMMILISATLAILGIKNALLIGFLGGLMNIIPYLGPLIGAALGLSFGVIYVLAYGLYDQLAFTIMAILGTFAAANLVDNFLLQPIIYSKSVKAHPIEIFLVIILAGKLAGIPGMIAAIPVYTVGKIVFRQFSGKMNEKNAYIVAENDDINKKL